jgi:RNA polymerase sigma factor (sigma-70 family)
MQTNQAMSNFPPTPEALLDRARAGEPAAIEALIELHQPDIRRFAFKVCRTPEDAEDAVQHTLYVVLTKIGGFRKAAKFTSWLFTVVKNECLRLLRRRPTESLDEGTIARTQTAPNEILDQRQIAASVAAAIAGLDPEQRWVFVMREVEQLSAIEVAAALHLSIPAVKSRLHRAREQMRVTLAPLARQFNIPVS